MSIDAANGCTLYLGTDTAIAQTVRIGQTGNRVDIKGDVYINGVLLEV